MAKTKTERIESLRDEVKQRENQIKKLIQEQKAQERKDRTRRLCSRMGLFEKMLPDTITLTDEQFQTFLEKTILSEYARKHLRELTAQGEATAAARPAAATTRTNADKDTDEGNAETAMT